MFTSGSTNLRPFTVEDLEVLAPWLEAEGLGVPAGVSHNRWGRRLCTDPRIVCRVATDGSSLVGFFRLDLGPDGTAEVSVMVAPTHRRRGFGRQLLAAARAEAQGRGVRSLVAAIRRDNAPALALFRAERYADRDPSVPGFVHLWSALVAPLEMAP